MNDARRKEIRGALELLDQAKQILEEARDGEQEYLDNMPESFQDGEKGERAQEAIDALDEAVSSIEDTQGNVEGVL